MSEESKYCANCQTENKKENIFCVKCGEKFEVPDEPKEPKEPKEENQKITASVSNDEKVQAENSQSEIHKTSADNHDNNMKKKHLAPKNIRKSSFFNFDEMISPKIIKSLYFFGVIASTFIGLGFIMDEPLGGLMILILSPIITRIISEGAILIFKIHETLEEIRRNQY